MAKIQLIAADKSLETCRVIAPHGRKRRAKVLVVEDEMLIGAMIQDELNEAGFDVVGPAATVNYAAMLIDTAEIDAAVLDVKLAEEFSYDLADRIIADGVPVIFCTGLEVGKIPARFEHCVQLIKPLAPNKLLEALAMVISV